MLTFAQKSNWIVNSQSRIAKIKKTIDDLENVIEKTEAHRVCVEHNYNRELGLCTGSDAEYLAIFEKKYVAVTKCIETIDNAIEKRSRLNRLVIKLQRHEKVIFALPHTW